MKLYANNKTLSLSSPVIMGILNVTPDSFSDGGQFSNLDAAYDQAMQMIGEGAGIIDIGGESTRPGADPVSLDEEMHRVLPVIERIRANSDCWISLDSSNAAVMSEAVKLKVDILNDVRAFSRPGALDVAAQAQLPVCIMHMRGTPKTMQQSPDYADVVADVFNWLSERQDQMVEAGIAADNIILDPGFGFGKTLEHNIALLANTHALVNKEQPVLIGLSRKSMFGQLLGIDEPNERVGASVNAAMYAAMQGAQIFRVHDVQATEHAFKLLKNLRKYDGQS